MATQIWNNGSLIVEILSRNQAGFRALHQVVKFGFEVVLGCYRKLVLFRVGIYSVMTCHKITETAARTNKKQNLQINLVTFGT